MRTSVNGGPTGGRPLPENRTATMRTFIVFAGLGFVVGEIKISKISPCAFLKNDVSFNTETADVAVARPRRRFLNKKRIKKWLLQRRPLRRRRAAPRRRAALRRLPLRRRRLRQRRRRPLRRLRRRRSLRRRLLRRRRRPRRLPRRRLLRRSPRRRRSKTMRFSIPHCGAWGSKSPRRLFSACADLV